MIITKLLLPLGNISNTPVGGSRCRRRLMMVMMAWWWGKMAMLVSGAQRLSWLVLVLLVRWGERDQRGQQQRHHPGCWRESSHQGKKIWEWLWWYCCCGSPGARLYIAMSMRIWKTGAGRRIYYSKYSIFALMLTIKMWFWFIHFWLSNSLHRKEINWCHLFVSLAALQYEDMDIWLWPVEYRVSRWVYIRYLYCCWQNISTIY